MNRDLRGAGGDVLVANAARDVHAVEKDAVPFLLWFQLNAGLRGEFKQRLLFVEAEIVFDGLEGKGGTLLRFRD